MSTREDKEGSTDITVLPEVNYDLEEATPKDLATNDIIESDNKERIHFSSHPLIWIKNTFSILKNDPANLLLIFIIPAIVFKQYNPVIAFIFNFIAIIPMSRIMTIGVVDWSARIGPAFSSVLHAFSGNFVELVIESYALADRKYAIVRSAILGSILCNITLVLGVSFLAGSWPKGGRGSLHFRDASFGAKLFVNTSSSILALAVLSLVTPSAFRIAAAQSEIAKSEFIECNLENISHATAIILMLVYVGLLFFQLKTHSAEVIDATETVARTPKYSWYFDFLLIATSITGISFCARYLVTAIEGMADEFRLGKGFVGIVLFPICVVSNFIEHYQAIKDAYKDRVDTAISLILNTSVQMALLVAPVLVVVGWIISSPLTLDFNVLEMSVLACAVLIVNYLVADNQANWLEGYMLVVSYLLIAIAFFYFPDIAEDKIKDTVSCSPFSRHLPPRNESSH